MESNLNVVKKKIDPTLLLPASCLAEHLNH